MNLQVSKNSGLIFHIKKIIIIGIIFTIFPAAYSQEIIALKDQKFIFTSYENVGVYIDSTNSLGIKDVLSKPFELQSNLSTFNKEDQSTYWMRLRFKRVSDYRRWIIELPDPRVENIQLYRVTEEGIEKIASTGHLSPFDSKNYEHKNFCFNLNVDTTVTSYYFKLKSSLKHVGHRVFIRSSENMTSYFFQEYFYLGLYYGVMLIMAVYNLLIFIFTKKRLYILYVIYVISCGLFSFQEDGLGFQFLWPDSPVLNKITATFTPLLLMVSFLVYSREFLSIKWNTHKAFNKLLFLLVGVYLLFFSFQFMFEDSPRLGIFYLPPFLAIYIMAFIRYFKDGFKPARFFIVGYSMILFSFFIFLLRINGLVESNLFIVYNFNFGFLFEVVILSFALGDRIRLAENEQNKANERALVAAKKNEKLQKTLIKELQEKEALKDKVNLELEQKVKERTTEITEANEKLKKLTDELNVMNSQLDIDNWNLKKKINIETQARITSKNVEYEDFIKHFNSQEACLKHLNKIKWGDGFVCSKCKHTKYTTGPRPYTRKCTNCKKIDSVTAQTIFHGVRIPLQKAFYITYITSVKEKGMTVDKLAEILELRRNTCWAFRKKVEERMADYMKKNNIETIRNWETLILD